MAESHSTNSLDVNELKKHLNKPVKLTTVDGKLYEGILGHVNENEKNIQLFIPINISDNKVDLGIRAYGTPGVGGPTGYGTTGYGVPGAGSAGYGVPSAGPAGGYGSAGYGAPGMSGGYGYGASPGPTGYGTPGTTGYGTPGYGPYGAAGGYKAPGAAGAGYGAPGYYGNLSLPMAALNGLTGGAMY